MGQWLRGLAFSIVDGLQRLGRPTVMETDDAYYVIDEFQLVVVPRAVPLSDDFTD